MRCLSHFAACRPLSLWLPLAVLLLPMLACRFADSGARAVLAVDPAQEVQAAGRIHRLGQEKDCFIKRLAFRDSIEEAVVALHEKIKAKEIKVVDGRVDQSASRAALDEFMRDKVTHDFSGAQRERTSQHKADPNSIPNELMHGDRLPHDHRYSMTIDNGQTKSRSQLWREREEAFKKTNGYELSCTQGSCVFCGLFKDLPGTFSWTGTGCYSYLQGDKRDPPARLSGGYGYGYGKWESRWVHDVPRPPDGWLGLALSQTDNGGELPPTTDGEGAAAGRGRRGSGRR